MIEYKEQVQQLDCGIAVVQMLHRYFYDEWLSLPLLKSNVNYDNDGISTIELTNLASKFGMCFEVYQGESKLLLELDFKIPIISIIKVGNYYHYIVVENIKRNVVIYYDPTLGKRKVNFSEFENLYTGIIIVCNKTSYVHSKENKSINLFKFNFIKEMIWISIISVVIVILVFISTFYMKIIIDQVIPSHADNKLILVSLCFILLMIFKFLLSEIKSWFVNKIEIKYNLEFLERYINKLSNIKWTKISHFDESMHLKNLELISSITFFKSNYLFTSISQGFCLIFSAIILIWLDLNIFLITFLCLCLIIAITTIVRKKFELIEKESIQSSIYFQKSFLNIINGIEQYKVSNIKKMLLDNINNSIDKNVEVQIKSKRWEISFHFISSTIKNLIPFIIVVMSSMKIWNNNLSIGEMILFVSMFNFFSDPLSMFLSMIVEIPITKQYAENINSFLLAEEECKNDNGQKCSEIKSVKIEKMTFSFNAKEVLLNIPKLEIKKNVHIIGKNGSGKSTLMKILSTLINTENISFNDKLIDFYNLDNLREKICYISSNQYMPSGTVYQYLTCGNSESISTLLESIEKYNLLDYFEKINLNLHSNIEEFGKNISAGQKQFIHLLKLFSSNYYLILLDEAFENLDQEILNPFMEILRKRLDGKIVVEASHRKTFLFNS